MEIQAEAGFPIAIMTMAAHRQSNAALIAAAPELLEALKSTVNLLVSHWSEFGLRQDEQDVLNAGRSAIAKATT